MGLLTQTERRGSDFPAAFLRSTYLGDKTLSFNITLSSTTLPRIAAVFCAAALVFAPATAHAQAFSVTFAPAVQSVLPGMTATFSGMIKNTTMTDLYINSDTIDPLVSGLTTDDAPFQNTFGGIPVLLGAGQTYALTSLFTVTDTAAPAGSYLGQFTLYGGTDPAATDMSGFEGFTVLIPNAPVPEASTSVSFAVLLAVGAAAWALKRRKSAAL